MNFVVFGVDGWRDLIGFWFLGFWFFWGGVGRGGGEGGEGGGWNNGWVFDTLWGRLMIVGWFWG